jgi:hypothetical protein
MSIPARRLKQAVSGRQPTAIAFLVVSQPDRPEMVNRQSGDKLMNPFTALFRTCAKVQLSRVRLALERLESRDLPSNSSVLPDVGNDLVYQIATAEFAQDGALTRSDVINLFKTVAGKEQAVFDNGMVSFQRVSKPDMSSPLSAEYIADLQNIVHNSALWGLSPDVANLAHKVVGFNQANENYRGQELLSTSQLAAADPARDLSDLVQKWFYGADLPQVGDGIHYEKAAGTLFGPDGPKASDVAEGAAKDCYFLSNLGDAARQSPQTIENMIIDNGDGTYAVRFYKYDAATKSSTPDFVTVNSRLPVDSNGHFVYANYMFGGHETRIDDHNNVLWVALVEKAYAQLAEEGWSRASWSPTDDVNAYASIEIGNNRIAGQQITGSDAIWVGIDDSTTGKANATISTLYEDLEKGDLLTICTDDRQMTDSKLGENHVYFVAAISIGADPQDDMVTLINPYTTLGTRVVTISLEELAKNADAVAVVDC